MPETIALDKAATVAALADLGYPSTQAAEKVGISQRAAYDIINGIGHWAKVGEKSVFTQLRYRGL